jgi:hypothetical protein
VLIALSSLAFACAAQPAEQDQAQRSPDMQQMQGRMNDNTQDPQERQRLMHEHMQSMQQGMTMMGEMMRGQREIPPQARCAEGEEQPTPPDDKSRATPPAGENHEAHH